MRLFNVRRFSEERGFTLAEILAALAIAGILAALATPNFLALVNRNKVQQVAESVQGALQDAQRQAIRLGKHCRVELSSTTTSSSDVYNHLTANPTGCFVAIDTSRVPLLPDGIRMRTNITSTSTSTSTTPSTSASTTPPWLEFSFRGHISQPSFGAGSSTDPNYGADFPTIVIYATPDNSERDYREQQRRCVVIASLLGAIRMGIYTGEITDAAGSPVAIDANKCQANLEGTRS